MRSILEQTESADSILLEMPLHIVPRFGPEHVTSRDCWCHPCCINEMEVLADLHNALMYVHNVMH